MKTGWVDETWAREFTSSGTTTSRRASPGIPERARHLLLSPSGPPIPSARTLRPDRHRMPAGRVLSASRGSRCGAWAHQVQSVFVLARSLTWPSNLCPRGLESAAGRRAGDFGARRARCMAGELGATGTPAGAPTSSQLATRVLWRVGVGRYRAGSTSTKLAYSVTWAKWFLAGDTIRIYVTAQKSPAARARVHHLRVRGTRGAFTIPHGGRTAAERGYRRPGGAHPPVPHRRHRHAVCRHHRRAALQAWLQACCGGGAAE